LSGLAGDAVVSSTGPHRGVTTITINRPARRNAINAAIIDGLGSALRVAEEDDSVHALVLTGAGDQAFSAGADLAGVEEVGPVAGHFARANMADLFRSMRSSRLPIVARVNGHALGGGFGLMLACDLVVAAEHAEFGTPEINVGLWPFIITAVLQRDVPRKLALELMFTGRRLPSKEGLAAGFVNRVVAASRLDDAVRELTDILGSKSPLALSLGKRSFYRAMDQGFDDALEYLAGMLTIGLQSEDAAEGISAFLQKRDPNWKGR
jgi:enoyl-CoA hydratase